MSNILEAFGYENINPQEQSKKNSWTIKRASFFVGGNGSYGGKGTVSFSSSYPCFELLQKTFAGFFLLFIRIFEGSALVRVRDIGFFSGVFGEEMDLLIDIAAHGIEDVWIILIIHEENEVVLIIGLPCDGEGLFLCIGDAVGGERFLRRLGKGCAFFGKAGGGDGEGFCQTGLSDEVVHDALRHRRFIISYVRDKEKTDHDGTPFGEMVTSG